MISFGIRNPKKVGERVGDDWRGLHSQDYPGILMILFLWRQYSHIPLFLWRNIFSQFLSFGIGDTVSDGRDTH